MSIWCCLSVIVVSRSRHSSSKTLTNCISCFICSPSSTSESEELNINFLTRHFCAPMQLLYCDILCFQIDSLSGFFLCVFSMSSIRSSTGEWKKKFSCLCHVRELLTPLSLCTAALSSSFSLVDKRQTFIALASGSISFSKHEIHASYMQSCAHTSSSLSTIINHFSNCKCNCATLTPGRRWIMSSL